MRTACYAIIIFCFGLTLGGFASHVLFTPAAEGVQEARFLYEAPETTPWDDFIVAVSIIESRGNVSAVGTKEDVGLLQITPVLLRDANRILGYDKYSLEDRTDPGKSIEIWNVIQDHYNPDHDFQLALKVWNPRAPLSYHRKIMTEYERIQTSAGQNQEI